MQKTLHTSESRGLADHGWLLSRHTFSFANYYDPQRIHFGKLRVLNDDIIAPGMGFGLHPHDNMEIISVPVYGALEHRDSLGSVKVIRENEVQVMSAGRGVTHSEYNHSKTNDANFLQLWIYPESRDIEPAYSQKQFDENNFAGTFGLIVSPDGNDGSLVIHQQAWLSMGNFNNNDRADYAFHAKENGLYVFVIHGEATVCGETLKERDGLGIWDTDAVDFAFRENSRLLLIEVPLK